MGFKLLYGGVEVDVQERAASAGVRRAIRKLDEENQNAVTAIVAEYPDLVKMKAMTDEEKEAEATKNPKLMADLISHNRKVGDANDDHTLGVIRAIVNHTPITDPEFVDALKTEIDSDFWQEQDPEALREVVDRFRSAYKL